MGMFDKVKKIGKKIVKGVKKVFSKVMKVVGKVLNSKIGKVIMLAATVVTAGAALYGAYAGMTGALANAAPGLATKFTAGFKGALAGLKTGAGLGQKALGQAAKLNFGGAKEALMGVGTASRTAGANAVLGLAKNAAPKAAGGAFSDLGPAKDIQPPVNALSGPGGQAKGTVGGLLDKGQSWSSLVGPENPASGVVNLANSAGPDMVNAAMHGAQTAGQATTEGLLSQLMAEQSEANSRLLWGNTIVGGTKEYLAADQPSAWEEEEKANKRGWAYDRSFDPLAYV